MSYDDMPRDAYAKLADWKESLKWRKKTLEIAGSRQVGKTHLAKKFAGENFGKVYFIDLLERVDRVTAERVKCITGIMNKVKMFLPDFEDSPTSVVIIAEIQEYSHIYSFIESFALEMKTHLIVTSSYPVKVRKGDFFLFSAECVRVEVRSLSFPEFLGVFDGWRERYERLDLYGGSSKDEYEFFGKAYDLYLKVGGYPAVIRALSESRTEAKAQAEVAEVMRVFCDYSRYYLDDDANAAVLPRLMDYVADLLLREKKGTTSARRELVKFDYGKITPRKVIERYISWLLSSRML